MSPYGGFGTTTEEMTRAAQHVASASDAVQAELRSLRAKLEPLAGLWTGRAASQFAALMARWDGDARSLSAALGSISAAIGSSGTSYASFEDDQAGTMSSITSALA